MTHAGYLSPPDSDYELRSATVALARAAHRQTVVDTSVCIDVGGEGDTVVESRLVHRDADRCRSCRAASARASVTSKGLMRFTLS